MNTDVSTSDVKSRAELSLQLERTQRELATYKADEQRRYNAEIEERLTAMDNKAKAQADAVEHQRRDLVAAGLPSLDNLTAAGYRALPISLKTRMIEAYSSDIAADIMKREKIGCSWREYVEKVKGQ